MIGKGILDDLCRNLPRRCVITHTSFGIAFGVRRASESSSLAWPLCLLYARLPDLKRASADPQRPAPAHPIQIRISGRGGDIEGVNKGPPRLTDTGKGLAREMGAIIFRSGNCFKFCDQPRLRARIAMLRGRKKSTAAKY